MKTEQKSSQIKNLREKLGLSQDQLANEAGLNLRTVQRIENGESTPRGDSLRRLATALEASPDQLINWRTREDQNVLRLLILSQLCFVIFPILGIVVPLVIWVLQKDKVKDAYEVGIGILNFQITWTLLLFGILGFVFSLRFIPLDIDIPIGKFTIGYMTLYGYNIFIILLNLILDWTNRSRFYRPAIRFLS